MTTTPATVSSGSAPLTRLRGFHPGWYGAVMGTAIVGIVAYQDPGRLARLGPDAPVRGGDGRPGRAPRPRARGALRRPLDAPPDAALADLANPVTGALYGTFPAGILVLAVGIATVGPRSCPRSDVRAVGRPRRRRGRPRLRHQRRLRGVLFLEPRRRAPVRQRRVVHPPGRQDHRARGADAARSARGGVRRACSSSSVMPSSGWGCSSSCSSPHCCTTGSSSTRCRQRRSLRRSGSASGRSAWAPSCC